MLFSRLSALPSNGTVLSTKPAADFSNPRVSAHQTTDCLSLSFSGVSNFSQMQAERTIKVTSEQVYHRAIRTLSGYQPANMGASLAIVANIAGQDYALLTYTKEGADKSYLKLPSSYLNSARREKYGSYSLVAEMFDIFASEVLVLDPKGKLRQVGIDDVYVSNRFKTLNLDSRHLRSAYSEPSQISLEKIQSLKLSSDKHRFLAKSDSAQQVKIDYDNMPASFQLNFDVCSNSLQIIAHCRIEIEPHCSICSAHYDKPDSKGMLHRKFNKNGIVLMQLDSEGFPNGKFFQLVDGSMQAWKLPTDCKFSEAFGRPDQFGYFSEQRVEPEQYFELMGHQTLA